MITWDLGGRIEAENEKLRASIKKHNGDEFYLLLERKINDEWKYDNYFVFSNMLDVVDYVTRRLGE